MPAPRPLKTVKPPFAPLTVPALFKKVALPAVGLPLTVLSNSVKPPNTPLNMLPVLLKIVTLPAVALFVNFIAPSPPDPSTAVTKFCEVPELFVMPVPLIVNVNVGSTVIVKECVSEAVNVIAPIAMLDETKREVVLERLLNVAMSVVPGGVPG